MKSANYIGEDCCIRHAAQCRQVSIRSRHEFAGIVKVEHEAPFPPEAPAQGHGCVSRANDLPHRGYKPECPPRHRSPLPPHINERLQVVGFVPCQRAPIR